MKDINIREALAAVVVSVVSSGCDNVGPPPTGTKIVRVVPHSDEPKGPSATVPAARSPAGASAQAPPLPDEVNAMIPVPGCSCGPGYYPIPTAEPFYQASLTATREGRFGDALDSASRADSVGMGLSTYRNQLAIALFNTGRAEEALAKWSEIAQGSPAGCELGFYADALLKLERPVEAETIARRYVNQCPQSSAAHYCLALALDRLGKWDMADQEVTESIKLDSSDAVGYHLRSQVREKRNLLDASLTDARTAVRLKPDDGDCHFREAVVLWKMDRYSEARQPIANASRLSPENAMFHHLRSMILEHANELDEALRAARVAVALDASVADYHYREAAVLWEMDRCSEARRAISAAAKLSPKDAGIHYLRSMILEKVEELDEALQAAKDAVEIDSNDSSNFRQLGDVYEALERPAEAIQAFDRSLALKFAPGVLYSRAMCHNKIGQRSAALRDLRELERKSPNFLNTRDWIESLEGQ